MATNVDEKKGEDSESRIVRWLSRVETVGNRLPDPLTLFAILTGLVVAASVIFSGATADVIQPDGTTRSESVANLLSHEGIRWMFEGAVDNFINFAPLGPVLTVMIGIGVAERTGFITLGLRMIVGAVPPQAITAALVFASVMSSMVADAGYIVLTPLGALLFAGIGRHPIAGLAAAYAGVSGGFSANLLITGLDPMLARLTDQAAATLDPTYSVNATANYYFMVVSVLLVTVIGTLVTSRIVEPMLGKWDSTQAGGSLEEPEDPTPKERRAFWIAMSVAALLTALVALLGGHPASPLQVEVGPDEPAVNRLGPFFESIEVLITILFIIPGIVFGALTGKIRNDKDVARLAADSMGTMGAYIVLAFVAGQFVAYFDWTGLGVVTAVHGADLLQSVGLTGIPLLLLFLIVSSIMNIFVGSASAKWAFMAPIFVPMLMMMGLSPEAVQAAYRVGDSVTNIITPLMPYLPIIIVFAQRYDKKAGIGTILTAMVPYSIALFLAWSVMLVIWVLFDLPFGPGASASYVMPG